MLFGGAGAVMAGETVKLALWLRGQAMGPGHVSSLTEQGAQTASDNANVTLWLAIGSLAVAAILTTLALITSGGGGT